MKQVSKATFNVVITAFALYGAFLLSAASGIINLKVGA